MTEPKKLYRNTSNAMVGGVASGIADHLGADATLLRVLTVLVVIFTFPLGLIAYLVMWAIIPPKPPEQAVAPAAQ